MTLSEENYLKAVFHLEKQYKDGVPTNALSEEMKTKASSATDMVKRLSEKGLLAYKPYQGVTLSKEGKVHALKVVRKHRLWEYFLVEKLDFSWDEVHDIAEQLEHIQSEKLTDKLEEFLDFPKADPHGDLIPDKNGNFATVEKVLLSECKPGNKGTFVGVRDSSKTFLQYLDKQKIALGDTVEVLSTEEFDQSVEVEINSKQTTVSKKTATNLFINLSTL